MSWMGWVFIGTMAFLAVIFAVVIIVSLLEGWKWSRYDKRN